MVVMPRQAVAPRAFELAATGSLWNVRQDWASSLRAIEMAAGDTPHACATSHVDPPSARSSAMRRRRSGRLSSQAAKSTRKAAWSAGLGRWSATSHSNPDIRVRARLGRQLGARIEADDPVAALVAGARVVNVDVTSATAGRVPDAAALEHVAYGEAGNAGDSCGEGILAALDDPTPGLPAAGCGLGDGLLALVMGSFPKSEAGNPANPWQCGLKLCMSYGENCCGHGAISL
jgi:hypothetical protein